jgi:hypothetical protein
MKLFRFLEKHALVIGYALMSLAIITATLSAIKAAL